MGLRRDRRVAAFAVLAAAACSRSELRTNPAASGAGAADTGSTGAVGSGAAGTGGNPGPPPPPCDYEPVLPPVEIATYAEGVHSPSLVAIDRGAPGEFARVALGGIHEHFWHPNLRVAEISMRADWPDSVETTQPMLEYGVDAHAGGVPIRAAGDTAKLALAYYHGDEASPNVTPGAKFRSFDTTAWSAGAEVFVDDAGDAVFSTVAGERPRTNGSAGGPGYGVAWRSFVGQFATPMFAVLDEAGGLATPPLPVVAPMAYPGGSATVAWTGKQYLLAAVASGCTASEPCAPSEVFVLRAEIDGGEPELVPTGAVPALVGYAPRRPTIASHGGATFMLWRERTDPPAGGDAVRLARISAGGAIEGEPVTVAGGAALAVGPSLRVSDQGVFVLWAEVVDANLPPDQPGHSSLFARSYDLEGLSIGQYAYPIGELATGTGYAAEPIDHPRSMLVAWAARSSRGPQPSIYFAPFACIEAGP